MSIERSGFLIMAVALAPLFPATAGSVCSALQICTDSSSDTWQEIYLPFGEDCWYPSLAINGNGFPCIAYTHYLNSARRELLYSEYTGDQWLTSVADPQSNGAILPSLALTSASVPVISAWRFLSQGVNLYTFNGSSWDRQYVCGSIVVAAQGTNTLILDENDLPHIAAAYKEETDSFMYACFTGSSWEVEFIDGMIPSLDLDAQGNPCFAHTASKVSNLLYTFMYEGQWWTQIVGGYQQYNHSTSLEIAADGVPHIVSEPQADCLMHTWDAGPGWLSEPIPNGGTAVAVDPDVACWPDGDIIAAYTDQLHDDLRVAWKSGGSWTSESIVWEGTTGYYPSIALDEVGQVWIAFMSSSANPPHVERPTELHLIRFGPTTSIDGRSSEALETGMAITAISPNPSSGAVSVFIEYPGNGPASADVFDITGRLIRVVPWECLVDGQMQVDGLEPGVYVLQIRSGSLSDARRFVILR